MSYTRVCIHYVWSTKKREPVLIQPYRSMLFEHIMSNARKKSIYIDKLNGYIDHVHCLVWLKHGQTIDNIAFLIKGESAHWFNHNPAMAGKKLVWQATYFAVSVSMNMVEKVRNYIDNQEAHHKKKSFNDEYEDFMQHQFFVSELDDERRGEE